MRSHPASFTAMKKVTLTLLASVHDALNASAAQQGLEPNELIVNLIINHVIEAGTLDDETKKRILLRQRLVDRAVEVARTLCRNGHFSEAITSHTIKICSDDPEWSTDYEIYIQDDKYKHGNPLKEINRELGYRIKQAIRGQVKKGTDGKPLNVKVSGHIIQSYTPIEKYDPSAF